MTLEEAKRTAPPVRNFGENQFIVGTPDDCEIITAFGVMGSSVQKMNEKRVLASRSFAPTDYANGQMSAWVDREEGE